MFKQICRNFEQSCNTLSFVGFYFSIITFLLLKTHTQNCPCITILLKESGAWLKITAFILIQVQGTMNSNNPVRFRYGITGSLCDLGSGALFFLDTRVLCE